MCTVFHANKVCASYVDRQVLHSYLHSCLAEGYQTKQSIANRRACFVADILTSLSYSVPRSNTKPCPQFCTAPLRRGGGQRNLLITSPPSLFSMSLQRLTCSQRPAHLWGIQRTTRGACPPAVPQRSA